MSFILFSPRMRQLAPLALVLIGAAVAIGAYLQAIDYPFVSDDYRYIVWNAKLAGLHPNELWRLFTEPYNPFEFLPLRDLSYWFDMTLFGLSPSAFRAHNIILYLLGLPFVYGITSGVWRYFRPADVASAPWAAAIVTALFVIHPSHVEAVVWATGRKDMLAGTLSMLALWFAVNARRGNGLSAWHAVATLVVFAAVMLSKASYIAVAPAIAMLWVIFWRDTPAPDRRRQQLLWPFAMLILAGVMVRVFIVSNTIKDPVYFGVEAVTRALAVLGRLTRLAISPESHHFFYPVFEDPYLPVMVAIGAVVLAAASASGVMLLRRRSLASFACVIFLLFSVPYMQFVPYKTFALVQDRYAALAVWPAALLIVVLSWRLKSLPRAALLLAIALPWGFQTIERPHDWRNFDALVDVDMRAYPGYYPPIILKIFNYQMPNGLFPEARKTAESITVTEVRDIAIELIDAGSAVAEAAATGDPRNAMARLQNLGMQLEKPPAQAKWDPSRFFFWEYCQNSFALDWQLLVRSFPDDVSLRESSRISLMGIMKYKTYANQ